MDTAATIFNALTSFAFVLLLGAFVLPRDASAIASFGAIEEVVGQSILEHDDGAAPPIDLDDDDYDSSEESGIPRMAERGRRHDLESFDEEAIPGVADLAPAADLARLRGVLEDLIACRRLLDAALKDG